MTPLERADAAKGGPFVVRWNDELWLMPDPVDLPFMEVLSRLAYGLPETPTEGETPFPQWKLSTLLQAWSAHYDLPDIRQAQRLAYLVDHYFDELTYDFAHQLHGLDFGDLWRRRRWATILRYIDRLPPDCWYSDAVARDPEHKKALIEAMAEREAASDNDGPPPKPPWIGWSNEVSVLTSLRDDIRQLMYVTLAVAGNKQAQPPAPLDRPEHPTEQAAAVASNRAAKAKHKALVARMLPHKARPES